MPCSGPDEVQSRTMRHGERLCNLILDNHERRPFLNKEEIEKVALYLKGYKVWNYKNFWMDELTKLLCEKIGNFNEEEKEFYLYNGRVSESRKLAEWWEKHQELDRKRIIDEIERRASSIAETEASKYEDEIFNMERDKLMKERGLV